MSDLAKRIAALSPEQRVIFEQKLKQKGLSTDKVQPIPKRQVSGSLPLSFAQQRLWFLDQLEPGNPVYNDARAAQLIGPLNVEVLEQTLNEIICRHEILRTSFLTVDGEPQQVIAESLKIQLPIVDLQHIPAADRAAEVQALATADAQRPFKLTHLPLLRVTLLRLAEQDHVLLFTIHHIISDGWSADVLIQDVAVLYQALSKRQPSPLSPLPIQYADYAIWQRQWLQGEVLAAQLGYWRQQLAGISTLNLPTDRPRPAIQTSHGAHYSNVLPKTLHADLVALSQREGVTLFMVLLAAFQVLLARYSRQDDIVVGTPIASRTRRETEQLIGFFVNTLVLRTKLTNNPTLHHVLKHVREVALGAYNHQDVPFERLVEELQPVRDRARTPVIQVLFALQSPSLPAIDLAGLRLEPLQIESGMSRFDLTLSMQEHTSGLLATIEYNTDLFNAVTIGRMLEHFHILLMGLVVDPDQRVFDVPLLTEAESRQLLGASSDVLAPDPQHICLHQLFEAQVAQHHDRIAVVYEDAQLTYGELDRRANQLAQYLRASGVGPEATVGLCFERSLDVVVAILAVLKAGGTYVPLDPAYPLERLRFMAVDAELVMVLTHAMVRDTLGWLVDHALPMVCLDRDHASIAQYAVTPPTVEVFPEQAAYIIYTSGSTGRPKGVIVSHSNVARLLSRTHDWFHFDHQDVWTLFHSYAFDFSVWECWGALAYGGKLIVVPYWVSRTPSEFYRLLVDVGVTILNQTPLAFRQLFQIDTTVQASLSLRAVIFGGEALDLAILRPWIERRGDEQPQIINMYGITETTVHVTYRRITAADVVSPASLIGQAIPDLGVYVLDERLRPVPIGVPGELYIGGAGLARGYLNRPELTAERFIPNPFSATPGARLYRSGDLGRWIAPGELAYWGRSDEQVKVRGFRIEVGEIATILTQHPGVRDAVVIPYSDAGDTRLVAYVVPQPEQSLSITDLRGFLQAHLPDYMVPASYMLLDAFPLTTNGKLDRHALPAPDTTLVRDQQPFCAPQTIIEIALSTIWSEYLGISPIGIHDDFFALGGHSLLAIQIIARVRSIFGVEVPLRDLFERPTIAALAALIETAQWSSGVTTAIVDGVDEEEEWEV